MEFFKTLFRLTKMSTIWLHMFLFQFEEAGTINMFPIFCQYVDVNVEGCIWKFCNDCNVLILDNVFAKLKNVVKNYNVFSYGLMANFQTIHYMYVYIYACNFQAKITQSRICEHSFHANISMYTVYIQLS